MGHRLTPMLRALFIALLVPALLTAESYKLDAKFPQLPEKVKLAAVSGVGPAKLGLYGQALLELIGS